MMTKVYPRLPVEVADHVAELEEQGRVDPRARLVEEDQPRLGHHRPPELEELLLPPGEIRGKLVPDLPQGEELERLLRPVPDLALAPSHPGGRGPHPPQPLPRLDGGHHHQVLQHRQPPELVRDLEGADDPAVKHLVGREAGDVFAPRKRIRPDDGGSAPATMLKMVVFPAPLGPMIPVIRPASIRNEHPFTAVRPPKRRVRSSTARIGTGAVADEGGSGHVRLHVPADSSFPSPDCVKPSFARFTGRKWGQSGFSGAMARAG